MLGAICARARNARGDTLRRIRANASAEKGGLDPKRFLMSLFSFGSRCRLSAVIFGLFTGLKKT